MKLEKERI